MNSIRALVRKFYRGNIKTDNERQHLQLNLLHILCIGDFVCLYLTNTYTRLSNRVSYFILWRRNNTNLGKSHRIPNNIHTQRELINSRKNVYDWFPYHLTTNKLNQRITWNIQSTKLISNKSDIISWKVCSKSCPIHLFYQE